MTKMFSSPWSIPHFYQPSMLIFSAYTFIPVKLFNFLSQNLTILSHSFVPEIFFIKKQTNKKTKQNNKNKNKTRQNKTKQNKNLLVDVMRGTSGN